jgi:hypothetical protein
MRSCLWCLYTAVRDSRTTYVFRSNKTSWLILISFTEGDGAGSGREPTVPSANNHPLTLKSNQRRLPERS